MAYQGRTKSIRYLLLFIVICIATLAFWYNGQHKLSKIMHNSYIISNTTPYLDKTTEQSYTKLLRRFSSELGIQAKLYFDPQGNSFDDKNLSFVLFPTQGKGYILYPPFLRTVFSESERRALDTTLSVILQQSSWHQEVSDFILEIYTQLYSFYKQE